MLCPKHTLRVFLKIVVVFEKILIQGGAIWPQVSCRKISAILVIVGDIGTFGYMGTEINFWEFANIAEKPTKFHDFFLSVLISPNLHCTSTSITNYFDCVT